MALLRPCLLRCALLVLLAILWLGQIANAAAYSASLCTTLEPGFEMAANSKIPLPMLGEPVMLQRGDTIGFNADLRELIFDGTGSHQTVLSDPLSDYGITWRRMTVFYSMAELLSAVHAGVCDMGPVHVTIAPERMDCDARTCLAVPAGNGTSQCCI